MRVFLIVCAIVLALGLLSVGGCVFGLVKWFANDAIKVAKQEFSPTRLLEKYEWFKDQAAALDKMKSNISVYATDLAAAKEDYKGKTMPRDVRQDLSLSRREVAGIKAQFNSLAAEYNAQMAKFNYGFCNAGQMPQGLPADLEPLPREFATYVTR